MTMMTPGALQQSATFDPTGGYQAGQRLMANFSLPNTSGQRPMGGAPTGFLPGVGGASGGLAGPPSGMNQPPPQASQPGAAVPQPVSAQPSGDAVRAFIAQNYNNPQAIAAAMQQYGLTPADVQRLGGFSGTQVQDYMTANPGVFGGGTSGALSVLSPSMPAPASQPAPPTEHPTFPSVRSPEDSWRMKETDPRFWTDNQNVLQQTDPAVIRQLLNQFGGPTTAQAQGALAMFGQGSSGMGDAYARVMDQQGQNQWQHNYLLGRVNDPTTGYGQSYETSGRAAGYTPEQYADLMYRTSGGGPAVQTNTATRPMAPNDPWASDDTVYDPWSS